MDSMFPVWLLPAWIIGAPLLVAIVVRMRAPGSDRNDRDRVDSSHQVHTAA